MDFLIIMLNVFALVAFVVIWLSISFIAFDLYKSKKNFISAIALSKIANIMKLLLAMWFFMLGFAMLTADNLLPLFLHLILFGGTYFYIYKMYGDVLKALSKIRKDDGSGERRGLIHSAVAKIDRKNAYIKAKKDFGSFRRFFWLFNLLICSGALLNFWLMDIGDSPLSSVIFVSIMLVVMLQVIFAPIYFIVKRVAFAALTNK